MGYSLQAFICRQPDASILVRGFDKALPVELEQGLALVPMTGELFDQINNFKESSSLSHFKYLNENVEQELLKIIGDKKFAYVEADYFGGNGGQFAIIWKNNKRDRVMSFEQDTINQVLKDFGVIANKGQDEFLTLGFGLRRNTSDWIEELE